MFKTTLAFLIFGATSTSSHLHSPDVPYKLPFHTANGTDILSSDGQVVKYLGTNWAAHQEPMIPEGLQYSSIQDIVSNIKGFNLNSVRLTFAIELVDDILDNGGDVSLENTLVKALGVENGTLILNKVLSHNPLFTKHTTRLEVFDETARELGKQGILLHLDNHMSVAKWCCGAADGNAWFGDSEFDVEKWVRGWSFMASHASRNWPSFSSVGLRNELRQPNGPSEPVDWYTWHKHMTAAASAVHIAAPEALIFFSGFNYDTNLAPVVQGLPLTGTLGTSTENLTASFIPSSYPYRNKIILELHKYDFEHTQLSCGSFGNQLLNAGYNTLDISSTSKAKLHLPVVLSEWGFIQNGTYWNQTTYSKCLVEFMGNWKPSGWMQWELGGSFYVQTRDGKGTRDLDEAWGLLNHWWNGTRDSITVKESLGRMIEATLV